MQAAVAGMRVEELRRLAGDLSGLGAQAALRQARPDLRRARRTPVATYRVRLDPADPGDPEAPAGRRLDLPSDLTLDDVHRALQAALDGSDDHPHLFSIGRPAADPAGQPVRSPYDLGEEDDGDEWEEGSGDGVPLTVDVRLDEALQEPGERLFYDHCDRHAVRHHLVLRLERVLPRGGPVG